MFCSLWRFLLCRGGGAAAWPPPLLYDVSPRWLSSTAAPSLIPTYFAFGFLSPDLICRAFGIGIGCVLIVHKHIN